MKLQIDTEAKTIKVYGQVNLKDFMKQIKLILPDWEEYKLDTNVIINNWSNPIVINPLQPFWINTPYWNGRNYCNAGNYPVGTMADYSVNCDAGNYPQKVFNVELN